MNDLVDMVTEPLDSSKRNTYLNSRHGLNLNIYSLLQYDNGMAEPKPESPHACGEEGGQNSLTNDPTCDADPADATCRMRDRMEVS